ncbi:MAG: hypothetical protein Q9182_003009 [Xanthomendoza sp. 2 TL-2023]
MQCPASSLVSGCEAPEASTLVLSALTKFASQAKARGSTNALCRNILRPLRQLIAIGIAYDTPSATTEAEMMALNALDTLSTASFLLCMDGQKIHPKMITHTVVRYNEFNGSSRVGCTRAKILDSGNPPSRAKAHVMRLLVVMMLVVAKRRQMSGKLLLKSPVRIALSPIEE